MGLGAVMVTWRMVKYCVGGVGSSTVTVQFSKVRSGSGEVTSGEVK